MNIQESSRPVLAIAEKHNLSIEEANERMEKSSVFLIADEKIKTSTTLQIAFLTTLNISLRIFKGEVCYQLPENIFSLLPFKVKSFNKLIERFGGKIKSPKKENIKILFGVECYDENCIEAISSGWQGGINFYNQKRIVFDDKQSKISLGAVLSSSLATFHAFCSYFQLIDNIMQLNTGLSLWNLNADINWYNNANEGPENIYLPANIWMLGLGHLGQAYSWTIGLMPYKNASKCLFLVQDADAIGKENIGSQILSNVKDIGRPKTRVCSDFLESLKFKTQIIEKPYINGDSEQLWMQNFPILLNGVDNIEARKGILKGNIKLYLDGATNGMFSLFDSFTMRNVFQIKENLNEVWEIDNIKNHILNKNLYDRYEKESGCGVIGETGISTPFVGAFGSVIIISELIRAFNGGKKYSIVSTQMRDLVNLSAVEVENNYGPEYIRWAI